VGLDLPLLKGKKNFIRDNVRGLRAAPYVEKGRDGSPGGTGGKRKKKAGNLTCSKDDFGKSRPQAEGAAFL